jgi:aminoglycoside phosphotransferase family enzyme
MIDALRNAAAYPHPIEKIEILETYISWVILTGKFAYKIKKPVDVGFLDFHTLEKRRHYCEEELRLNRIWAPRLYVDVVPIVRSDGGVKVGGEGTPIEYAVRMRQFDQGMRLDHQIESGSLTQGDILELADEIARRHARARRIAPGAQLLATTERLIWDNFSVLDGEVPGVFLCRLRDWMQGQLDMHGTFIRERIASGYYRECHGDLHLGNIVHLAEGIRAFDCIEFSRELREIDVVADYAFLAMDFIARGASAFAWVFVNHYLEKTGDYEGVRLLPMYIVYRSMVRAKVAVLGRVASRVRTDNAGDRHSIARYCALARALSTRRRPMLILMTGFSGSGKTWLSTRLIPALPALRLRSDIERKRLFEMDELADSESGIAGGIYEREAGAAVYERLLQAAEDMLRCGNNVILDAAFLDATNRGRAREVAEACGAACVTVQTVAGKSEMQKRLRQRGQQGTDASEADADVLQYQLDTADPLGSEEMRSILVVDTEVDADIAATVAGIRWVANNR